MKQERSADRRKHHIIYKTTCLVTGRYYIGMHSTDNPADGYIGSGKRLWQSIKKHGAEQHVCETLEQLPSREALRLRETELVNTTLLKDPQCMNLALGGEGSWDHLNSVDACQARAKKMNLKLWADPSWVARHKASSSERFQKLRALGKLNTSPPSFQGQKHTVKAKQKMVEAKALRQAVNPSTGKPWVYHPMLKQSKKISACDLEEHIAQGWVKGRRIKWDCV